LVLEPYFASPLPRPDGRGRPWVHARAVLNGVLYVLRTGCAWADLPRSYPPKSTCHDRFQVWIESGVFAAVLDDLARDLEASGWLDLRECFSDGSFAPAQRGGTAVGKTKKGKGSKIMAIVEAHGLPVAVTLDSAHPHEVKLVEPTLSARLVETKPEHLIGDNAYDSDRLDADLAGKGIEMLAPHRSNRKAPHARWTASASLSAAGAGGAVLCLAPTLSAGHHTLGGEGGKLPGLRPPGLRAHPLTATTVNGAPFVGCALALCFSSLPICLQRHAR
jgi:transposase